MVQVAFDPTEYTVNENAGTVTLMVRKTGQSVIPVAVNITTSGGSATGMYLITRVELTSLLSPSHLTLPPLPPAPPSPLTLFPLTLLSLFFHLPSLSLDPSPPPSPFSPSLVYHLHSSTDGTDFTGIVQRTLTFPPGGDDVIQVSIPIINDTIDEPTETFFSTLFTSQRNVVITEDAAIVDIIDNDGESMWCCVVLRMLVSIVGLK